MRPSWRLRTALWYGCLVYIDTRNQEPTPVMNHTKYLDTYGMHIFNIASYLANDTVSPKHAAKLEVGMQLQEDIHGFAYWAVMKDD